MISKGLYCLSLYDVPSMYAIQWTLDQSGDRGGETVHLFFVIQTLISNQLTWLKRDRLNGVVQQTYTLTFFFLSHDQRCGQPLSCQTLKFNPYISLHKYSLSQTTCIGVRSFWPYEHECVDKCVFWHMDGVSCQVFMYSWMSLVELLTQFPSCLLSIVTLIKYTIN